MYICFVDESGGTEMPNSNASATPLMAIVGLVVESAQIAQATNDLLQAKVTYFPHKCRSQHFLDNILAEAKGADVRAELRSNGRNTRRHAKGYLDRIVSILEQRQMRITGRVWVKAVGETLDPVPSYTYAIQDIARHFEHFLANQNGTGLMICDSRMHNQNSQVSHSIFTQKHSATGDQLPHVLEAPSFGSSGNHAGLQLADTVASALIFPMAARVYFAHQWTGVHTDPRFDEVRSRYAGRLAALQVRYKDGGKYQGGIVVSDRLQGLSSGQLFQVP